jgi:UDP-N-acetylmuramoylalanine--D-glutamate ligase
VYTNVTSDHLDRHGSLEAYRRAKRRLAELVDRDGALVINSDDPVVATYASFGGAPVVSYRLSRPAAGGLGLEEGWIVASAVARLAAAGGGEAEAGPRGRIMPVAELAIPGLHNVSNALAAVAVAMLFGVAPEAIRSAAAEFAGVEHRLERVATVDGVQFINDSQGTQPDAVMAALQAFPRPLVLIAGGRDKGVDLSGLGPVAAARADAAVLIGESGPVLAEMFRGNGMRHVELAASLEEAVGRGDAIARDLLERAAAGSSGPATVLLSPAAASFDMFVDYAARGRAFKAAVAALADRRRTVGSSL